MDKISEEALKLHKERHGKIEVVSKVPINDRTDLARAYTPGVGAVSEAIGKDPALAYEYTMKQNMIAIVSDGSAILGLGNLGPEAALPVMEGKAALFKRFANVDAFPLCLATQDTEEIIETVKRIAPVFGGVNLEDIAAPRCFEIERRLQAELKIPVMHDDQHGTAVVVLAGLINALKLKKLEFADTRVVISGAGAAGVAITKILLHAGIKDIVVCDSKGALGKDRTDVVAPSEKAELVQSTNPRGIKGSLAAALRDADVFIGVSKPGVLTAEMIKTMREKPVVFALANPTPEIMPDEAARGGAFVVATGRSDFPNQVNNVLAFPGIFRGALDHHVVQFTEKMFVDAAHSLAEKVKNLSPENILPDIFDESVAPAVADVIRE